MRTLFGRAGHLPVVLLTGRRRFLLTEAGPAAFPELLSMIVKDYVPLRVQNPS
jgi:hypothetical protein